MMQLRTERPLKFLWMDDQIDTIRNYTRVLSKNREDVSFEFAETIHEAQYKLDKNTYAGFIVDCQMSQHDDALNGAHLLLDVNGRTKAFPTFVYSAYLDDPKYHIPVAKSYAVAIGSKADTFRSPLERDPFFVTMLSVAQEYSELRELEPERIEFNDYDRAPEKYANEVHVHWRKHRRWIRTDMERQGFSWVVVCGDQIVKGSREILEFPGDDEIAAIGEDNNLIPFAYSVATLPEDDPQPLARSRWSLTNVTGDNYPSIKACIDGMEIIDDFDTGAAGTFASDVLFPPRKWNFWTEAEYPHMGVEFSYYRRKMPIRVIADDGVSQTRSLPVVVVKDWKASAFTMFNPARRALFGRDLLRVFDVEITLHAKDRETSVRILS